MKWGEWLEPESVIQLQCESNFLGIAVISSASKDYSSRLYVCSDSELADFRTKGNRDRVSNWWKTTPIPKKEIGQIRLIGHPDLISEIAPELLKLAVPIGRPVLLNQPQMIQFLSETGRIRVLKTTHTRKRRVLVVDDSESIRTLLSRIIGLDPQLECVATAALPSKVEEAIARSSPDVITLDIHMPEMDGVTLLKKIIPKFQIPTVMISSLSREEGTYVLDALEAGAIDYIQKPSMRDLQSLAPTICEKIKEASHAKIRMQSAIVAPVFQTTTLEYTSNALIAIGASTGGTEALKEVLTSLPPQIPPIVIVQHIPPVFSKSLADRLNSICEFEVKEAEDGDEVKPNRVLIAPGDRHMRVLENGRRIRVNLDETDPVNRHRPSIDRLFDSVCNLKRRKLVAAILTGMGSDGAEGLLKLKNVGAQTLAQDEASCVVYGMPKEAVRLGAAGKVVPLNQIARTLIQFCSKESSGETRKSG